MYDCYACISVDRITNTYPIRNPINYMEQLLSLEEGDRISVEGLGVLEVVDIDVSDYTYMAYGRSCIYEEINVICFTVY